MCKYIRKMIQYMYLCMCISSPNMRDFRDGASDTDSEAFATQSTEETTLVSCCGDVFCSGM